ncbi:MAG: hypothetical protein AAF525_17585, partial [Pseudomonadota bacterium]
TLRFDRSAGQHFWAIAQQLGQRPERHGWRESIPGLLLHYVVGPHGPFLFGGGALVSTLQSDRSAGRHSGQLHSN